MYTPLYQKPVTANFHNFVMEKNSPFNKMAALTDVVQITVRNAGGSPVNVDILSRSQDPKIIISANTMPISQFANRLNANPMLLQGLKIISADPNQINNPIELVYQDGFGSYQKTTLTPAAHGSSFQSNSNIVEIPNLNFVIGVDGSIHTTINPGVTVNYVLNVKQLFDDHKRFVAYKNFMQAKKYKNFMRVVNSSVAI